MLLLITLLLSVIELPGPLTVSLMTYAPDVAGLAKQARAAGHELLAHVPMEPRDRKENPGPHALTVAMDPAAIRGALPWNASSMPATCRVHGGWRQSAI